MPLPFEVEVQAQLSAGWTDITSSVRVTEPIKITRGLRDETTKSTPQTCALTFNDLNGDLNPLNPLSPYYEKFGRNTPVEVLVREAFDSFSDTRVNTWANGAASEGSLQWPTYTGAGGSILTTDWQVNGGFGKMTCPVAGSSRQAFTGTTDLYRDVDVETEFALPVMPVGGNVYPSTVILRSQSHLVGPEYHVRPEVTPLGNTGLSLRLASAGAAYASVSNPIPTYTAGTLVKVRAQVEGQTLRGKMWLASQPEPVAWSVTAHAEDIDTAGRIGVRNHAANNSNFPFEFRTNSFKVRHQRFVGEISDYETGSDDDAGKVRWTKVVATGITRRLSQGTQPDYSPMYRASVRTDSVTGYWPCEDNAQTLAPNSAATVGRPAAAPMRVLISEQRKISGAKMAAIDSFHGSKPLPDMDESVWVMAPTSVPPTTSLELQFVMHMTPSAIVAPNTSAALFYITMTGDVRDLLLNWQPDGTMTLFWTRYFPNGNFRDSGSYGPIGFDSATRKVLVRLTMNQAGSNIDFILHTHGEIGDNANTQNGFVAGTLVSGSSLGAFTGLIVNAGAGAQVNGMKGCAVGHVLTRAGTNANNIAFGAFETPFSGHRFETAYARMVRVSAEQGVLFSSFGSANSARLGPQPSAPVVGVFQDAADTDMGLLYEPKGALGIEYRTALSLCTGTTAAVATFNLAAGHMTSAFRPVLDDQNTANKIVAKRAIGGESTVSRDVGALSVQPPPLGVGPYEQTRDFNNASHIPYGVDPTSHRDTTADRAGWALNLGTAPDPRFPEFQTIMNTLTPAHRRTVTDIGPGSRVDVTGAERLGVYGTQRQIVRGYSEVITNHVWTVRLVTAPWSPYDASKLEATTHVRLLPSFGATLNTAVNTTVGTLLVTTNAADQWVTTATHPAAFPFGMMIGGEEVTVTAIVGAGTSKTVTVTRSVNGVVKSHAVGAAVTVKSPIKLALS